jgi:low temperature requirement protein LtrA
MESLKDIWNSLTTLYKDKVRFYTLKGVEKSSLFMGLIATILFVSAFCIMVLIFGSVALANFLNTRLESTFLGYLIVSGAYLVITIFMLIWMVKRKTPLFAGIFVRTLISLFNITEDED